MAKRVGWKDVAKQTGFANAEYGGKKRRRRRERFHAEMDAAVPWARPEALH